MATSSDGADPYHQKIEFWYGHQHSIRVQRHLVNIFGKTVEWNSLWTRQSVFVNKCCFFRWSVVFERCTSPYAVAETTFGTLERCRSVSLCEFWLFPQFTVKTVAPSRRRVRFWRLTPGVTTSYKRTVSISGEGGPNWKGAARRGRPGTWSHSPPYWPPRNCRILPSRLLKQAKHPC